MHVQFGCGFTAPKEWLNFDASITLRWERTPLIGRLYTKNSRRFPSNVRYGDIVKGLPVDERSCKGVYASHVLEHLALEDFHKALQETKRILAVCQRGDSGANAFFLSESFLGYQKRDRGLAGFAHMFLNTSRHLWMWDALSLANILSEHGFGKIRRCSFGDCEDPMFGFVEEAGRFEHAVAMEA